MSYSDLLQRMMHRDTDAFLEFTDRYGWALYSSIRRKHPNKVDADKVYHETMQQLWSCLQNQQYDDPMEAILCVMADQITLKREPRKDLREIFQIDEEDQPPVLHIRSAEPVENVVPTRRKHPFWRNLGILVLLIVFVFSIWLIAGFLMANDMIPYVDLGYSWFCTQLEMILTAWGFY